MKNDEIEGTNLRQKANAVVVLEESSARPEAGLHSLSREASASLVPEADYTSIYGGGQNSKPSVFCQHQGEELPGEQAEQDPEAIRRRRPP
jgi:hypothetical protein